MKNRYWYSIVIVIGLHLSTLSKAGNIVYPWRATTAILKAGETFDIWFVADSGQNVNSILLRGPYQTVKTNFSIETGNWVYDVISQNTYNTRIKVKVPSDAPADRYDIVLNTSTNDTPVVSESGVKVIKDYKKSYYVMHFSDMHAFQKGSVISLKRLSTMVDIANIIDPEIVFNTGDNLHQPNAKKIDQLFSGLDKLSTKGLFDLNAASFSVVGNHDMEHEYKSEKNICQEKAASWNLWWGLEAYNFKYGNGRFMVINNGWDSITTSRQTPGASDWLQNEGTGNFRLIAVHIKNKELDELDSLTNPNLILVGHHHHIGTQNPFHLRNKPTQHIANSVREYTKFNLYKVDNETGIFTPVGNSNGQVEYVDNPQEDALDIPYIPKLSLTFLKDNNGTNASNTATLVNNFDFPIEGAKVRFVVPKGKKYAVSTGTITQLFKGISVQIVDVLVYLEPHRAKEVSISPSY